MTKINPAWIEYNKVNNEGGEGYNPHAKYIAAPVVAKASQAKMIAGKMRTHADAVKFARNCLSGAQRQAFEAEITKVFGG